VASNIARENQIHLSLASNDITFRVKALLDLGSSSKAYNLFSKYTNSFNRTQINYLNAIFSFLSYPVAGENILTSDSSDFGEIILRKKIVLSGPLSDVESLLKDSHVLVNVNHRNLVFDYQPTISYYSGGMANLIHDNNIQLNEKIDFAVLKNAASESYFKKFISHKSRVPVRSAIYASGSPNLIQFALLDLLNFNPSEIYVSGINFGLSKVTHKRNYHNLHVIENGSLSGRRKFIYTHPSSGSSFINCRTHGIARHDRISQLNFCSLLAASERINFDPSIKSILDQTPDVFYSELEKFVIST